MSILRFAVLAALLALPVQVNAGVLQSFLSGDGLTDIVTDESIGKFFDNDGDGAIGVGDDIVGFQSYRNTSAVGNLATNEQLNTMFGIRVTSSTNLGGVGGAILQEYGAIPVASPTSLQTLLDAAGVPGALLFDPDSVAAVFTSVTHTGSFLTSDFATALAFVSADMVDGLAALKAGDFFQTLSSFGIDKNGNGKYEFLPGPGNEILPPGAAGTPFASESAGLSYVPVTTDLGQLLPVGAFNFSTSMVTNHELAISGQLLGPTALTDSDFNVTDKTTLALNPVPEPGTLAIWSVIGLIGFRRRARR